MRVLCWSGPRNLSTAMMYAFAARPDFGAMDEPFYAAYLAATGLDHPMREAVLASQPTDPDEVSAQCRADGAPHVYQKHMTHHMRPGFPRDFMTDAAHVFLIRHPARVLASYAEKRENPTLADIGAVEQLALLREVEAMGLSPVVVDSADIRAAPGPMLRSLCAALGLPFDPAMLSWPAGPKPFDGAWAPHWYNAVHQSTGFAGAEGPVPVLSGSLAALADRAMPAYEALRARAISARGAGRGRRAASGAGR